MKLFGLSSLLGCVFFLISLGIPGVIACSTFQVTFFCFFEEVFSAEMIQALPPVLCHFHQFCHILCGGGGGGSFLSSSKHVLKCSFFSTSFPVDACSTTDSGFCCESVRQFCRESFTVNALRQLTVVFAANLCGSSVANLLR